MTEKTTLVARLAGLAQLDPGCGRSADEAAAALNETAAWFGEMLEQVEILKDLEADGVEPLYMLPIDGQSSRSDTPADNRLSQDILNQAPDRVGDFFVVPRIL